MYYSAVWESRYEDDVLNCLEEACYNAGYDYVYNFHKIDRAREEGVDVECERLGEKIHFQVKMKPKKKDITQLKKLSNSVAGKKIYVHVKQPSVYFKKQMKKVKGTVEFWDDKKLHEFLVHNRSLLYFRFLFLSSRLTKNISKVLFTIFSCSQTTPQQLNSLNLNDWWTLKDRTVKLHTSLQYLEAFWKDTISMKDKHDVSDLKETFQSIFYSFEVINEYSCEDLKKLIKETKEKFPSILSQYVEEVLKRSNWIGMGAAKREIGNKDKAMKVIEEWTVPSRTYTSEYSQINGYLENLRRVAGAMEDGVDWLFEDYLSSKGLPYSRR